MLGILCCDYQPPRAIFQYVPKRSQAVIQPIIQYYVKADTTVYTDSWRAYGNLNLSYDHHTVNHSRHFKDPVTGKVLPVMCTSLRTRGFKRHYPVIIQVGKLIGL